LALWRPAFGLWGGFAHLMRVDTALIERTPVSGALAPLMGIGELASLLGVPVGTIYDWRTRGEGPVAYRFGKHLRFTTDDVEAWMATRREVRQGGTGADRGVR